MLKIGSVVGLSDNREYVVASRINHYGQIYYFFVDFNNSANVKICVEQRDNEGAYLSEVTNRAFVRRLFSQFGEETKEYLNSKEQSR